MDEFRTTRTTRTIRTFRTIRTILFGTAVVFALAAHLAARNAPQNPQAQSDHFVIETGARLYAGQCAVCHGANGDQINGVDLRAGKFLTVVSDEDLARVLESGKPAAGMPSFAVLHTDEARAIIAYIRSRFDATTEGVTIGDAGRGASIFEGKGSCTSCHRVNGHGAYTATDLTEIGTMRAPASLQRALVDPARIILPGNRSVRAITRDGRTIRGRRVNEDTYTIQLIDEQSRLVSLIKADLRSFELIPTSSMPSYETTLTADERADVIAYLLSLKGR
jgi:putative heme-binding domain-containing protein